MTNEGLLDFESFNDTILGRGGEPSAKFDIEDFLKTMGGGEGEKGADAGIFGAPIGAAQLIIGALQKKKAKRLIPSRVDAQEARMNMRIKSLRDNIETGVTYAEPLRQLERREKAAINQVQETAGGFGGGAIAGIAKIHGATGEAYGDIFAEGQKMGLAYEQLYEKSTESMIKRKQDIDILQYAQKMADAQKNLTGGAANVLGAAAKVAKFLPLIL